MDSFYFDFRENNIEELIKHYEHEVALIDTPNFSEEQYELIINYFLTNNNPQKALEATEKAMIRYPFSSEFQIYKLNANIQIGDYTTAESLLTDFPIIDKSDYRYYIVLSDIYRLQELYYQALDILSLGLETAYESRDELYIQQAEIYTDLLDYENRIISIKNALAINPGEISYHHQMIIALKSLGKINELVEFLLQSIEIHPFDCNLWLELALSYFSLKNYEQAFESLSYLLAIEPDNDYYLMLVIDFMIEHHKYDDVVSLVLNHKTNYELSDDILNQLGIAYRELNQLPEAIQIFEDIIANNPDYAEAYYNLAVVYYFKGNFSASLPLIKQALKLEPDNPKYMEQLGNTYVGLDELNSALSIYTNLKSQDYFEQSLYTNIALCYFFLQNTQSAIDILNEGIDYFDYFILYYYLAYVYFRIGQHSKAMTYIELGFINCFDDRDKLIELMPEILEHAPYINLEKQYHSTNH